VTAAAQPMNVWDIYDLIGYKPHTGQEKILASNARHRVVSAGRRFGKSDVGGHELVPEALFTRGLRHTLASEGKRREFWIVGPEYSDAEKEFRVVWNTLKRLRVPFDKPGSYNSPIDGNMHISLWDGTFQVHSKSAKYPDTLVGEGLHGVIMSEAAKIKERVWIKHIRPTLNDFKGWSIHSSTPEGRNWFYENWQRGQDPTKPDWASWKMPAWRNPYVYRKPTRDSDVMLLLEMLRIQRRSRTSWQLVERYKLQIDDEIVSLIDDLTEQAFMQEIAAEFTDFVGKVFKSFDEEIHVSDLKYNPTWQTYGAVDYGYTNPNVWLLIQVGPWGEIHVLDEYYKEGETAEEFADNIKAAGLCPGSLIRFYPDPADPGNSKILSKRLRKESAGGTGGEKRYRIDAIRKALKLRPAHLPDDHPEKQPQIKFNRSCKNAIREMQIYRYPDKKDESSTKTQEEPMKKDDHVPEALGRFFAGFFNTPQRNAGRGRSKKAKVSS
jgi:hypothetical protein